MKKVNLWITAIFTLCVLNNVIGQSTYYDVWGITPHQNDYITKFGLLQPDGKLRLEKSVIFERASNIGIGTTAPTYKLDVRGEIGLNSLLVFGQTGVQSIIKYYGNDFSIYKCHPVMADRLEMYFGAEGIEVSRPLTLSNKLSLSGSGAHQIWSINNELQFWIQNPSGPSVNPLTVTNGAIEVDGLSYFSNNVGIGIMPSSFKLDVNGTINTLGFKMATNPLSGSVLTSDINGEGTWQQLPAAPTVTLQAAYDGAGNGVGKTITAANGAVEIIGKLKIGNFLSSQPFPEDFNLYVSGGIITEQVMVKLIGDWVWPDYVFSQKYNLKTISELEKYIIENQHLPDVPTADEVAKDGINVAEMDAILLKKIEELTLYVIEIKKENTELQKQLDNLRNDIK